MASLFAGKMHALLCRQYVKGRDWFDFLWYASRNTSINLLNLQNALIQQGPWKGIDLQINQEWVNEKLKEKIETIDWKVAQNDVRSFLRERQMRSLDLWDKIFFLTFVK